MPCFAAYGDTYVKLFVHSTSFSQIAVATGVADEALGNVRTVRAFAMEEKEME